MRTSPKNYCYALFIEWACLIILINALAVNSAPLESYFPVVDDQQLNTPQKLQLINLLQQMTAAGEKRKEGDGKSQYPLDNDQWRMVPQKRFRPFRTQTRAGGVALCLWKVCPAAPWLVSRRR